MYDLIIIGSGPAGLTAAIYAARAELNMIVIEKDYISGGQVNTTDRVDNYPALPGIGGMELADKMRAHCDQMGVKFVTASVTGIRNNTESKTVVTDEGEYETKTVIIATGAHHGRLDIPGEKELAGRGVSYCATCDGNFFKDKDVAVIGGGNIAAEDAIYLSNIVRKVYVVHRRDQLRAEKMNQTALFAKDNVEMVWNSNGVRIDGTEQVSDLIVKNKLTQEDRKLDVDAVFIAVGVVPNSDAFQGLVDMDDKGFIISDEGGATSVPGIFAAGDVRAKELRQVITACGDGANAVHSAQNYLTAESTK